MDNANSRANDPNKGFNINRFLIYVVTAMLLLLVGAAIFLGTHRSHVMPGSVMPKPTSAASPQ